MTDQKRRLCLLFFLLPLEISIYTAANIVDKLAQGGSMTKDITQNLKVSDLQGLHHYIFIKNETSQTRCLSKDKVILQEIFSTGLSLELPTKECQHGHHLTLALCPMAILPKIKFEKFEQLIKVKEILIVQGKITEYEINSQNKSLCNIRVELTQYKQSEWDQLKSSYEAQQKLLQNLSEQLRDKAGNE
jgi:hypothetical protein